MLRTQPTGFLVLISVLVLLIGCSDESDGSGTECEGSSCTTDRDDRTRGDTGSNGVDSQVNDAVIDTQDDASTGCIPGTLEGCLSSTEQRVCNERGEWAPVLCPDELFCLDGACGTQICHANETGCSDDDRTVLECDESGEAWVELFPCPDDEVCLDGSCVGSCLASLKDPSYMGCEYWSVDLPQYNDPTTAGPEIPHSVVVSNVSENVSTVTIETRSTATPPAAVDVPPGEVRTIEFPRLDVDQTTRSFNSFRILSTEPIIAYQFNPLNNVNLYSNDASLLLPANAIGNQYYVMTWPGGGEDPFFGMQPQTAWFTVVAVRDGTTTVDITFSADVTDGPVITGIMENSTHRFEMEQGEVLNFECSSSLIPFEERDLTGTFIDSDLPVVVFAGHEQAVIGEAVEGSTSCCADHLEQQLLPISVWGSHYMAVHSPPRGSEDDYWKVMASENGTTILTTPPITGLHGLTLDAGESVVVSTIESFEIEADKPILVGQFIVSQQVQGVTDFIGDPTFVLIVPVGQYRDDYVVLTPQNYAIDYVTVVKPVDAEVFLDDSLIEAGQFTPFGTNSHEFAHISVEPDDHHLTSTEDFSVVMYGYDGHVSYGYPGGLDLSSEDDEVY